MSEYDATILSPTEFSRRRLAQRRPPPFRENPMSTRPNPGSPFAGPVRVTAEDKAMGTHIALAAYTTPALDEAVSPVAGRRFTGESEQSLRDGVAALFAAHGIPVDAYDPVRLMLFPEMDPGRDVPEITTACWGILHKSPNDVMCASARAS